VDGFLPGLLSTRAELTGLTAISIIYCLLMEYHGSSARLTMVCDNQGAISKAQSFSTKKLRCHREGNIDLYMSHRQAMQKYHVSYQWVHSHSDKANWETASDLQQQGLSHEEIYNVWCDRIANQARFNGDPSLSDLGVTPAEKWAIYSSYIIPQNHWQFIYCCS
jgi:hypothetical protein